MKYSYCLTVRVLLQVVAPRSIHSLYEKDVRGSLCTLVLHICPARQVNAEKKRCLYQHPLTHPQPSNEHEEHRRPSPAPSLLQIGIGVCYMVHTISGSLLLLALDSRCPQEQPPVPLPCSSCWHQGQEPLRVTAHSSCWCTNLLSCTLAFIQHI